jgi:hypothetical protein
MVQFWEFLMRYRYRPVFEELERIEAPVNIGLLENTLGFGLPEILQSETAKSIHASDPGFGWEVTRSEQITKEHRNEPLKECILKATKPFTYTIESSGNDGLLGSFISMQMPARYLNSINSAQNSNSPLTVKIIDVESLMGNSNGMVGMVGRSESSFVDQNVPINADNDHNAPIAKYAAVDNQGNPVLDNDDQPIFYSGFIPEAYEYDYAYPSYTAAEDDTVSLELETNESIPFGIIKRVEWKFDFVEGTDPQRGKVKFWKSQQKHEAIIPSPSWRLTPPHYPELNVEGTAYVPYVEGVEPSEQIYDVGTATYALRVTYSDDSVSIVNYKPIKLSVTPVRTLIGYLTTLPDPEISEGQELTLDDNTAPGAPAGDHILYGTATTEARFKRISLGQNIQFVQFVNSHKNELPNNLAITYNQPSQSVRMQVSSELVDIYPKKELPMVDNVEFGFDPPTAYPTNFSPIYDIGYEISFANGTYTYTVTDTPKLPNINNSTLKVGYTVKFMIYVGIFYENSIYDNSVYYPMAKKEWEIKYSLTGDGLNIENSNYSKSSISGVGFSSITHQFESNQILAPAFAPLAIKSKLVN